MKTASAESAHRLGELALLTTAFVLPLAFHLRAYDPASIKLAVLQWSSLTMLFGWLWQGVSRGRFQAPASSWSVLLPAMAYGAWVIASFAVEPRKVAALPGSLARLTMLVGFLSGFLGFAGARSAARFATLTIAAAWIAALYGLAESAGFDPFLLKNAFGSFLAVAVPLALTLELDPEAPSPLRAAALLLLPVSGAAVLTSSPAAIAGFCASCALFAVIVAASLRTGPALRSAGLALITAVAVAGAALASGPGLAGFGGAEATGPGVLGTLLSLWLFGAALWTGARGASSLRRAGALQESTYAAGFAAAAAGALAAAQWAGQAPAVEWYAWPLAGLASGLAPLAARRAAVSVYPLPVSESVRRALYAPALLAFAALAVAPGLWLRSDVNLNSAVYFARMGDLPRSLELFESVRPGGGSWVMAQYFKGNALNDAGRHEEALAAYDRLQEQAPDYLLVHAARGAAYAKLGDWKSAAAERARQAELDPLYLENLVAWAEAARADGSLDEARLAAEKAAALAPDDQRVRSQIAANGLMARRLASKAGREKASGRDVVKKPR